MEAIILIGIQASGKSTFYKERFFATHIRLNLDMLKTRHRLNVIMHACIEAQQRFVVDNTNLNITERAAIIQMAKAAQFSVIGYFFTPQLTRALLWNATRAGKARIPEVAIWDGLKRLERPTLVEGFNKLYTVSIAVDNQFEVTDDPI